MFGCEFHNFHYIIVTSCNDTEHCLKKLEAIIWEMFVFIVLYCIHKLSVLIIRAGTLHRK